MTREPTIKLGPAAAAIERRAEAAAERTGKAYVPVTERGLHNARIKLSQYVERGQAWVKEKALAIGTAAKEVAAKAVPGFDVRALAAAAGKASAEVTAKALAARQAREAAIQAKAVAQAQARAVLDAQKAMGKAIEFATPGNVIRPGIDGEFSR